jgi:NTE family protein
MTYKTSVSKILQKDIKLGKKMILLHVTAPDVDFCINSGLSINPTSFNKDEHSIIFTGKKGKELSELQKIDSRLTEMEKFISIICDLNLGKKIISKEWLETKIDHHYFPQHYNNPEANTFYKEFDEFCNEEKKSNKSELSTETSKKITDYFHSYEVFTRLRTGKDFTLSRKTFNVIKFIAFLWTETKNVEIFLDSKPYFLLWKSYLYSIKLAIRTIRKFSIWIKHYEPKKTKAEKQFLLENHVQRSQDLVTDRPRIGLVLGGGGAKGAAEVGALKVIEEMGIPIDYIVGTSIGSIIGGLYDLGYRTDKLIEFFHSKNSIFTAFGSITGYNTVLDMLKELTNDAKIDNLPKPFCCIGTDITEVSEYVDIQYYFALGTISGKIHEVHLSKGSLAKSMRASMSFPGVFQPIKINGRTLVDGGMLNNLPVDVAYEMGADVIIAIDLSQSDNSNYMDKNLFINGLLDWLISRPDHKKYINNCDQADIHIHPDLHEIGKGYLLTFKFFDTDIDKMIDIGENATREFIPLLQMLKQ